MSIFEPFTISFLFIGNPKGSYFCGHIKPIFTRTMITMKTFQIKRPTDDYATDKLKWSSHIEDKIEK